MAIIFNYNECIEYIPGRKISEDTIIAEAQKILQNFDPAKATPENLQDIQKYLTRMATISSRKKSNKTKLSSEEIAKS
jgi:hypothetical protein